jgi:hypothetical protein
VEDIAQVLFQDFEIGIPIYIAQNGEDNTGMQNNRQREQQKRDDSRTE